MTGFGPNGERRRALSPDDTGTATKTALACRTLRRALDVGGTTATYTYDRSRLNSVTTGGATAS